ncbi:YggS family pyridoxal phosphate-dependent enzyme [Ferrimonas balearica]|uniref:YggS family pyridoxal phosphate-dependent enzyme n=1 Tax=Ferrimonas balearica TaxID=44012 RepID=UPI001C57D1A1|nr:YggS family pyridoxal phosphate-dependent enzyme [Ferrimonas balearica]MBW3139861.1 YggS family pyridoxal phosphate-dependent enzyme [Ferrimonas balearica]MBW3164883.1 YggS family pyridoxal phosphate-dependent enzyme [Ferrimonas balearica]MBY6224411.1 YggS family pyridoxal phosphate-dependent enzyme [Ferrimonas balearica]
MSTITERLIEAQARIDAAAAQAGRVGESITLLAVSKTKPAEMIREAYLAGARDFGENYLQEGVDKIDALQDLDIRWHFIGPLQSNKTRPVAERFDWIHSVDRLKIAQRLSEQRPSGKAPLNVCIQVNISAEQSKSGVNPAQLPELAAAVAALPGLRLRGLMAIPAPESDPEKQRQALAQMKQLFDALKAEHPGLDTLSMGMSDDLEAAVAEGSTMVRIGTAIFGTRK